VVHPTHAPALTLLGQVTGAWSTVPTTPKSGQVQKLSGSATVSPLGTFQASGTLSTPGRVLHGNTTATVVLSAAQGSITLQFTGPSQPGLSPPPGTFSYTITGGTGTYAGHTGKGAASFKETVSSAGVHSFTLTFRPIVPPPLIGQVSGIIWPDLQPHIPEARILSLSGGGSVSPLGTVDACVQLVTDNSTSTAETFGTAVLSNAQGSITLQLTGSPTRAYSPPPTSFSYTISGATGAYAGETGKGTASYQETGGFVGNFTLTLNPAP
jgi:hypothetical protein